MKVDNIKLEEIFPSSGLDGGRDVHVVALCEAIETKSRSPGKSVGVKVLTILAEQSNSEDISFSIPGHPWQDVSLVLRPSLLVPLGDVVRLTDTRVRTMCPAPEVNEGIAIERANGTSKIVLTSPALSIIVTASAVIAAHLHMDER